MLYLGEVFSLDTNMEQHVLDNLKKSDIKDLQAIAESSISSRLGLRSSGKVSSDDRAMLVDQLDEIYKLNKEDLISFIEFHSDEYKREKQ